MAFLGVLNGNAIASKILLICVGCAVLYTLYHRFSHSLARFPGPFAASLTNFWKLYHIYKGDYEHVLLDAHRKYGKIVRIGPNHLDVSDASAVKSIYGAGRAFPKSTYYDAFTALRPNLFGARDEEVHSARRKACSSSFSLQSVAAMEPFIDGCLKQLIHRLDQAASKGEQVDLKEWIAFFVMDVLGELAFSETFGVLKDGDASLMPPIRGHVLLATISGNVPWIIPYINRFLPYIPIPAIQKMINGRLDLRKLAINSVNRRIKSDSQRKDLLGRLLDELQQGVDSRGNAMDIKDIQTEAFGFIVAGSHTTAATTTLLMWHLFHNKTALVQLQDEIRAVPLPVDSPCYPYSALAGLPFLQASLSENFRISPVFVMPLMRVVPEAGKTIAGQFVPGGTDISICNHVLHHDSEVFGPDVDRFIPQRWLKEDYSRSQYLMPFGAGHRACIGRNIAMTEICKLVGSLLARYDFEHVPQGQGEDSGMPKTNSFGVADLEGSLLVRVGLRESNLLD